VITQFAPITPEVIDAMKKARVIVRYGVGVDNVNLEAARLRGVPVCNIPTFCIDEVADHTLGLILAATRALLPNANLVRDGKWGLAGPLSEMRTLRDQTVGVVGFGRIGAAVAARLAPFKCKRLAFDPMTPASVIESSGCQPVTVEKLLAESDIVTLHCPSTPQTRNLLNASSIATMKPGAIVVNVARGDVIETAALVAALQSGQIAAAALDVCNPEPIPLDSPLRSLPNVVVTSHIASASVAAVRTLRETAAQIAVTALRGASLPNIVNGL
jgi:D-3-phosphoglycerate dehydrogenase